jgi:hypothetical protein
MGEIWRGIVNTVVGIFLDLLLWCRIFFEVMVCLPYEDVMFWSMDVIVFHCSKLHRVVFFRE